MPTVPCSHFASGLGVRGSWIEGWKICVAHLSNGQNACHPQASLEKACMYTISRSGLDPHPSISHPPPNHSAFSGSSPRLEILHLPCLGLWGSQRKRWFGGLSPCRLARSKRGIVPSKSLKMCSFSLVMKTALFAPTLDHPPRTRISLEFGWNIRPLGTSSPRLS